MKNEVWLHTQKNITDCGKTLYNERVVERYLEPCQTHQRWTARQVLLTFQRIAEVYTGP